MSHSLQQWNGNGEWRNATLYGVGDSGKVVDTSALKALRKKVNTHKKCRTKGKKSDWKPRVKPGKTISYSCTSDVVTTEEPVSVSGPAAGNCPAVTEVLDIDQSQVKSYCMSMLHLLLRLIRVSAL